MSRLLTPFRRLRWKLTFTYTLATVAAVLVLEAIALCAVVLLLTNPAVQTQLVQEASATMAEEVQPFLSATPPDRARLALWLRQTLPPQTISGSAPEINLDTNLEAGGRQTTLSLGEADRAAIIVPSGELLAGSAELSDSAVSGEPYADPYALGESRQIIARALLGEPASARLQDRSILAAQPVLDDGNVVGVVYLRIASFALLAPNLLGGALGIIGGSALLLTIGAGFVGTLFGFLTAHGLVRRLETLAYTTEAWGRGDFAATVDDTSADEIGQLSRRLDLMAGEIQDLLQARQELATLEERNRLARDLHDSVKQQVFATTMNLGAAETLWERDPEAARQKVAQALAISRTAQQELSGLIHELRPVTLEGKELIAALREHVTWWSRQTGIAAGVVVQGEGALPLDVEQAYFRIAQEALANVAKHSEASRVEVTLSCSGDNVILEVRDDGHGFVLPAAQGQGMGLRSMRERVEALGGDLRVESAPGEGTCVTARCGLEPVPGGGDSA